MIGDILYQLAIMMISMNNYLLKRKIKIIVNKIWICDEIIRSLIIYYICIKICDIGTVL